MKGRRLIIIFALIIVALAAAGAVMLDQALRPCEPLDLRLQRSGCVELIDLPAGFEAQAIHVANVGDQLVLVGETSALLRQVSIVDTQTWAVIDQMNFTDVDLWREGGENLDPRYEWNTTRLARGVSPRLGYYRSGIAMPDNSVYGVPHPHEARMDLFAGETDALISTIVLPEGFEFSHRPIIFSHDGSHILITMHSGSARNRKLTAWDVASGQQIFEVDDSRIIDYDWLADNRTIVAIWEDDGRRVLALFRVSSQRFD